LGMRNSMPVVQEAKKLAQGLMSSLMPQRLPSLVTSGNTRNGGKGNVNYTVNINVSGGGDNQKLADTINNQIRNANSQFVSKLESFLEHKNRTSFSSLV